MGRLKLACLAVGILGATPVLADNPEIGTAAFTKNSVTGRLAAERRQLKVGDRIFQSEAISTGNDAGAQLLFRDETVLNMGPDSSVVLDTLIYDPTRHEGKMAIKAVTGAFRFVTGSGPKNGYKIQTPSGTIGVRGSIVQFWIASNQLKLQVDEGAAYFCTVDVSPSDIQKVERERTQVRGCADLDTPGTYLVVTGRRISETRSVYGPSTTAPPGTSSPPNQYQQFLDTQKFTPPPPPPPSPPGVLPNGLQNRPRP